MKTITFTAIEADVLEHRIAYLAELDDEDLAELFPGVVGLDFRVSLTNLASEFMHAAPRRRGVALTFSAQCVPAILAEALEGSTHHEMADESEGMGMITQQKRAAYRKAMSTAAEKVAPMLGREIKLP